MTSANSNPDQPASDSMQAPAAQKETKNTKRVTDLFLKALEAVSPEKAIHNAVQFDAVSGLLSVQDHTRQLEAEERIYIIGSGKAAASMAKAMQEIFGSRIADGLVIAPAPGEGQPPLPKRIGPIQVLQGAHPLPDHNSLAATYELLHLARTIPKDATVFTLLSGGTSALLCMPDGELELEELAATHQLLLNAGAGIHEMNRVRKSLSAVKGGRLLEVLSHTRLTDLVISDVPDDDFATIGSGPTTPGTIDYQHAFTILKQYGLWEEVPHEVRTHLARGMHEFPEGLTVPTPEGHRQVLVSSARILADEAGRLAENEGYHTAIHHPAYDAPIEEVEQTIREDIDNTLSDKASQSDRVCHIYYGESSVHVTGNGKGGRNQELALRLARHLKPGREVTILSAGTDGVDGPTDAAGAVVHQESLQEARERGLNPGEFLANNDAWSFFHRAGGHLKNGPTGNNLMDFQMVLIG
ncbi:MAG: DUF4147 domain-containing protein [Balneolaceae bacterium]